MLRAKHDGLLLKDLAEEMGITASALTQNLQSENLTFETAVRLALALNAEFAVEFDGEPISANLIKEIEQAVERQQGEDVDSETAKSRHEGARGLHLDFPDNRRFESWSRGHIAKMEVSRA